jgi:hypothetical protein
MKITKKQWMIIGVVIVAIILVWYFFLRKTNFLKKAESNYRGGWKCPKGYYRGPCLSNGHWGCCPESLEL